jgi:hypothetical protein
MKRHSSISRLLADELRKIARRETAYAQARASAFSRLDSPFRLGGRGIPNRQELHDRKGLR